MANHFNDLLLQTLKQINVRLDRVDGRMEYLIDTKADKADLDAPNEKFNNMVRSLERIEAEIDALKWIIGAEVAVIGVVLAFI